MPNTPGNDDRQHAGSGNNGASSQQGAQASGANGSSGQARTRSNRGFASMDREKQKEIASKGGRSVPAEKRSFSQDRELASEAGRKGGQASGGTRSPQDQD